MTSHLVEARAVYAGVKLPKDIKVKRWRETL